MSRWTATTISVMYVALSPDGGRRRALTPLPPALTRPPHPPRLLRPAIAADAQHGR